MVYDLTKVHQASLLILKEIDRICRKHGIQYQLDAGTLLGAVRHQGFIPWDDDADVAFTRDNFTKFLAVVKQELPSEMALMMPEDLEDVNAFYDFTPRILYLDSQMKNDSAEMQHYKGLINHLWVDLFIIDEISDHTVKKAWTLFQMKMLYGFAMGHRFHLDYSKYGLLNKVFVFGLAFVGKMISIKTIRRWEQKTAVKYHKKGCQKRYYSNYQPDFLYVTLEKEWCEQTVDLEFEGIQLMAPVGWDAILTQVYGDYQTPPPKDQQIPAHSQMNDDGFYVKYDNKTE